MYVECLLIFYFPFTGDFSLVSKNQFSYEFGFYSGLHIVIFHSQYSDTNCSKSHPRSLGNGWTAFAIRIFAIAWWPLALARNALFWLGDAAVSKYYTRNGIGLILSVLGDRYS